MSKLVETFLMAPGGYVDEKDSKYYSRSLLTYFLLYM